MKKLLNSDYEKLCNDEKLWILSKMYIMFQWLMPVLSLRSKLRILIQIPRTTAEQAARNSLLASVLLLLVTVVPGPRSVLLSMLCSRVSPHSVISCCSCWARIMSSYPRHPGPASCLGVYLGNWCLLFLNNSTIPQMFFQWSSWIISHENF